MIENENIAVRFHRVSFQYPSGTQAIHQLDLTVPRGSLLALLGASGCGKSTVLRLIAGLEQPTTGNVEVWTKSTRRSPVAFVFQDANLLPWRTVAENIRLPGELYGQIELEWLQSLIEKVGLSGFEKHYPRELSGGMRMRASLARALSTRPEILLLDEPFAALDEITRQKLQEDLLILHQSYSFTTVFVTHSVFEAVYLADRIALLSRRPAQISDLFDIDLPQPRRPELRADPDYALWVGRISSRLRELS